MGRAAARHRISIILLAGLVGWGAVAAVPVFAQGMTGPIDLGGPLRLNNSDPVPPPPKQQRNARPPAHTLNIKAFFGSFSGSGLSEGEDATYFGVTDRDLDVRISATGDGGFSVAWTTVLREGGNPKAPNVRRREATVAFAPSQHPGLFRATDNGDPLAGGVVSWAHVSGDTLTIQQFSVHADGRHEIQTYARTLAGSGMNLVYTRVVDGERTRHVRGKLVKNGN
jgi:hypothetical protein